MSTSELVFAGAVLSVAAFSLIETVALSLGRKWAFNVGKVFLRFSVSKVTPKETSPRSVVGQSFVFHKLSDGSVGFRSSLLPGRSAGVFLCKGTVRMGEGEALVVVRYFLGYYLFTMLIALVIALAGGGAVMKTLSNGVLPVQGVGFWVASFGFCALLIFGLYVWLTWRSATKQELKLKIQRAVGAYAA